MYDVIIVGAGPSGLTAALNLKRNGKSVLLIERESIGGQVSFCPKVENIPGFPSITGSEFADKFFSQISDLGVELTIENVLEINKNNKDFIVKTDYATYQSKGVIIAAGLKPKHINVENEDKYFGKGISYCALCDGAFFENQDVCLIGDANTALQYAIVLSGICKTVYLNTLFDHFFGDKILVDRVKEKKNIIVEHNLNLIQINGKEALNQLVFENTQTKEIRKFDVSGCFIAIGQNPDNERYSSLVNLEKGFIVVDDTKKTKTDGLYAVGDCTNKKIRQVVTAFNDGAIAAFYLNQYLETR